VVESACEKSEEKLQPIFEDRESESVAVRIARAIIERRGGLYRLRLIPICTRRGKWRLRVVSRLLNRLPPEGYGSWRKVTKFHSR